MEDFVDRNKRRHEAFQENASSPAAKRFREDFLFVDVPDDDACAGENEVFSVMKSLEEEIGVPSRAPPAVAPEQPDLGFLFGASDDELGLPPPAACSSEESGSEAPAAAVTGVDDSGEVEGIGLGQIWGFADEIDGYDGFGLEIRAEEWAAEEGLVFDGGLFDFADALGGPFDYGEISWRS